jgi:hypothetical protein
MSSLPAQGSPYWHSSTSSLTPEGTSDEREAVPPYRLYDSTAVTIASFLGTPLAGATLMAINCRRLGKLGTAVWPFASAAALIGLAIGLGSRIPSWGTTAVSVSLVMAMKSVAEGLQGKAIADHLRRGGQLYSRWLASGIGLIWLTVIAAVFFTAIYVQETKVTIGSKDEVYYSGGSTKDDAKALGAALQRIGYFQDIGTSVLLSKDKSGVVLSCVVKDGMWNQPAMVAGFEEVGREVAPSIGGYPLELHLVNSSRVIMKDLTVGRAVMGTKDEIYYLGSATQAEANGLGQMLKSAGFFQDRGVSVFLSKGDDGTAISFVVAEGAWDSPDYVTEFESLVRQGASSVGGLPITLRLVNSKLETKKVEKID